MITTPVPYRPVPTGRPSYLVNTIDSGFAQSHVIVWLDDGSFVIVLNDSIENGNLAIAYTGLARDRGANGAIELPYRRNQPYRGRM